MHMHKKTLTFPLRKNQSASDCLSPGGNLPDKNLVNPHDSSAPEILLTATLRWPIAARIEMAFANMGCHVEVLCPRQHPVTKMRTIRRNYPYQKLMPLVSLRAAIQSAAPDLIIPCDDDAALDLHRLYVLAGKEGPSMKPLRDLIERSLGTPEACVLVTARARLMALAADEGVRVPETASVTRPGELNAWFTQHEFPAVLKLDRTWGGLGVSIIHNREEAERISAGMMSRPPLLNAVARTFLERDLSFFLNYLKASRRNVSLQEFIQGTPANRAVACWKGNVLAGISVEAIETLHLTGPATVMRVIENPEMSEAVIRLVRRLGVSGLWGADFMLQASTGAAYLIELNPRATPICHLPLGVGRNLLAALFSQLTGTQPLALYEKIDHDVIALFPGEWHRNPASPYLQSAYHDLPLGEPGLIQDGMDRPWAERGWIARLWARMQRES